MDCHWCRAGYKRLSDEEICNRFDRALAQGDQQMFEDTLWQSEHATYHKVRGLQPADAEDAAQAVTLKLWEWLQRQQAAKGGKTSIKVKLVIDDELSKAKAVSGEKDIHIIYDGLPRDETIDGEMIFGLLISKLKGFNVKGRWVQGEEKTILWEIECQEATRISTSEPIGDGDSNRTIGDTLAARPLCEDDQEVEAVPIEAIERALADLDTLVGGMERGATRETLAGMLSYARQCVACSAVPVIVSAGIRYRNEDGKLVQMERYRLGGVLVQQPDGHPLDGLDYLQERAPTLKAMQWQIRPEVSAYLRTLPGWNTLARDTFDQRVHRAVDKLTEKKLLQLVPLTLEGDDYDILHLS